MGKHCVTLLFNGLQPYYMQVENAMFYIIKTVASLYVPSFHQELFQKAKLVKLKVCLLAEWNIF